MDQEGPIPLHSPVYNPADRANANVDQRKLRRVKPVDSWVLPVTINNVKTYALLDTGAGCSLLSKAVYESMSRSLYPLRVRTKNIAGVGNNTLPTMGDLVCSVTIASCKYPIDMVVSTENEAIGCILGMDFLQTHSCELALQKGYLLIDGMRIKLRRESATNTVARIKLDSDVTLPPRTELAISGRPEHIVVLNPQLSCTKWLAMASWLDVLLLTPRPSTS